MKEIYKSITDIIIKIYVKINKYLTSAFLLFNTNNIPMLPAYIAFFTLWSIVPIIIIWDTIEKVFPTLITSGTLDNQSLITTVDFINIDFSVGDGGIILFLLIIYLSSKPFMSIISASNSIYDLRDKSNYFKMKVKSIILFLLLLVTLVLLLLIPILGEKILRLFEELFKDLNVSNFVTYLKWPLTILYLFVVVFVIYSFSPDKRIKYRYFLPGTVFTTFGWLVITYLYSIYVNDFANYAKVYSSFTSVIILMIWLYFISYILIIGLVINAAYFREKIDE